MDFWTLTGTGIHDHETIWITGKPERVLVHKWRAAEQSILAGAGTIRADNPMLNVQGMVRQKSGEVDIEQFRNT